MTTKTRAALLLAAFIGVGFGGVVYENVHRADIAEKIQQRELEKLKAEVAELRARGIR